MKIFTRETSKMSSFFLLAVPCLPLAPAAHGVLYPPLRTVEQNLITTATLDFGGHEQAFHATLEWDRERLQANQAGRHAPHLVCAAYGLGRQATSLLRAFLSPAAVQPVAHSFSHGMCFFATASYAEAKTISVDPARFSLLSVGPFPSALKLAPGLLEHGGNSHSFGADIPSGRLTTRHGSSMHTESVDGLSVEMSPGALLMDSQDAARFIDMLQYDLMSDFTDLLRDNVWSDPQMAEGEHLATPEGALRAREWTRAATVLHELSAAGHTTVGDVCSWDSLEFHHVAKDILLVSGLDHLLYQGPQDGGQEEEALELHVACFMGLVSFVASRSEVLRISTKNKKRLLNAAARAIIQTATTSDTPLTDAGLDGTGEVIQIVDSGLNETSCFFADGDGQEVQHGHYFEELGTTNPAFTSSSESSSKFKKLFAGGDFTFTADRRKIIQYINMVKTDAEEGAYGSASTTSQGARFPFLPTDEFDQDDVLGHGTHVAGSAAGSTASSPAQLATCVEGEVVGCAGGCLSDAEIAGSDGSTTASDDVFPDIDLLCPAFGCGAQDEMWCLGDDVGETLAAHGGMSQGAKLSIFDMFYGKYAYVDFAGNGVWESCLEAGCKVHSNSYGVDSRCELKAVDLLYDDFMYQNTENLLIFAAGNEGGFTDRTVCTTNSPGIAKNVLSVGATSAGEARLTGTAEDGKYHSVPGANGYGDIDTIAQDSSYGPTQDGRIKPEVVAPGDQIFSATDDGRDEYSCRLKAYAGTSMATAVAAGAAAMVRQYFADSSFYAADVKARGFCEDGFVCDSFSPSSATVKAMLINSANLMGGSAEPGNFRGFGRIHLDAGMPLKGEGQLALFVADAGNTAIAEDSSWSYYFEVDATAGLELRATLSWIDPPASSMSTVQLINDLDLRVSSPAGTLFTMRSDQSSDTVNVNERIIVGSTAIAESGMWTVQVASKMFSTTTQSYSLVVTGAISPGPNPLFDGSTDDDAEGTFSYAFSGASSGEESPDGNFPAENALSGNTPEDDVENFGEEKEEQNKGITIYPSSLGALISAVASMLMMLCAAQSANMLR